MMSFLIPSAALGKPLKGISLLGICNPNFPCAVALGLLENQPVKAIGYLSDSFGHECPCLKTFLDDESHRFIRVHLANGTCFPERRRRCGRLDVFYRLSLKKAEDKLRGKDRGLLRRYRASIIRTTALLGPETDKLKIRYSLCLECPFSRSTRSVLLREALRYFPREAIVDSPLFGPCLPNVICEWHGDSPRYRNEQRCISDSDGITPLNGDMSKLNNLSAKCEAIFYWTYGFNLLEYGYSGPFISPNKRTAQVTEQELDGVRACLDS
ncbi:hypothetical protein EBT16_01655 [bacterium]|nr:hypothetical protein [bacterium]